MKKDLNYWKKNAEEDYMKVPISVLRYITELEKVVLPQAEQLRKHAVSDSVCGWCGNKLCDSQKFNNTCFKCGKSPYSKQTER